MLDRIKASLPSLAPAEQRVGKLVLADPRAFAKLPVTELADRVGVTLANLSILKTGKARAIRFTTLDALCRALDCQPGDLLRWEDGPPDFDGP